jgi:protein TonB
MFAESLLESSPHIGHRAGWAKLSSLLLQCTAVAVVLAVPLFHIERLQALAPPPSVRLTSVQQPVVTHPDTARLSSGAVAETYEIVQPPSIPSQMARMNDAREGTPGTPNLGTVCLTGCGGGVSLGNIVSTGTMDVPRPAPPTRPLHVSEMQLGTLVRKVLPEYPAIAKQIRLQGAVVLLATIAKDGHVENVEPVSGPAMLVLPAKRAVEQWQYRPYILNHEPVEVQTQITVNFVLNQ